MAVPESFHPWHKQHPAGSVITVRTVTNGQIRWAAAAVTVIDDDQWIAFCQTNASPNKVTLGAATVWPSRRERELALQAELKHGRFELVAKIPAKPRMTLTVARAGDWFSVRLARDASSGRFVPEYVNIERPYRRTRVGFDADDLCLDLEVEVRGEGGFNWRLKDAADLTERAAEGIYSPEEVLRIRRASDEAVARIDGRQAPFDGSWAVWEPDESWPVPTSLSIDWAEDPATY